jgi:AcrR family transcriptional regulator
MPDTAEPLRDRLLEVKRAEIIRVASELFCAQGYTQTSMEDIASRLGIGKPQIYACFPNKAALLAEVCNWVTMLVANAAAAAEDSQGTPTERITVVVRELSRHVLEGRTNLTVLFRELKHLSGEGVEELTRNFHSFNRSFEALLQEGIDAGEFRVNSPIVATHAISGMTTWMYSWFDDEGALSAEQVVDEMVRLALLMIGAGPADGG